MTDEETYLIKHAYIGFQKRPLVLNDPRNQNHMPKIDNIIPSKTQNVRYSLELEAS